MQLRSAIVWRGARYGMLASAAPFAVLTAISVFSALRAAATGAGASALGTLAFGVGILACGAALGLLPGLATGAALVLLPGKARALTPRSWAAIVAGAVFFTENMVPAFLTGGPVWVLLAFVGTPIAAVLAAVLTARIRGGS
ncbi:hypothetical protein [Streptomyces sp. NPDC049040]|uniref:hypothetical protein n=1 Tax=Streptomyces sp. NPDC049040 TaxID=3365593 RepID=UPI003712BD4B